jgi:nicotinamidase-related amidase
MQRPALLVIDMVNDYLDKWDVQRKGELICAINGLARMMRRASHPVIWVRQEFEPDLRDAFPEMRTKQIYLAIKGTAGCQILSQLEVVSSDPVVVKKRYSAFFGTGLEEILHRMQPDTLILTGINTHACIRTTAIDAYQRDWPLILAADCIDSYDREHHYITLRYMRDKMARVLTNDEIGAMLNDSAV